MRSPTSSRIDCNDGGRAISMGGALRSSSGELESSRIISSVSVAVEFDLERVLLLTVPRKKGKYYV